MQLTEDNGDMPDDLQIFLRGLKIWGSDLFIKTQPFQHYITMVTHPYHCLSSISSEISHHSPCMASHTYFHHLSNLDVILHNPIYDISHLFTVAQLHLYSKFDWNLWDHLFNKTSTPIPEKYKKFQKVWACDRACIYQFLKYNAVTGEIITHGQPITTDLLLLILIRRRRVLGIQKTRRSLSKCCCGVWCNRWESRRMR